MRTITTDIDLRDRVLDSLRAQALLDASGITVEVHDGRVLLGGRVASPEQRSAAEWAAGSVEGVKQVDAEITIDLAPPRMIS